MTRVPKDIFGALGGWIFLAAVAGLYAVTGLFESAVALEAVSRLGSLLTWILPVILLVFALMFLTSMFLERRWLVRQLGRGAGLGGWALTVLCGILSAGPIYAWYPLLGELKEKGVSDALITTFLYCRALKLPLIPLMVQYFGLAYTVTLSVCIVAFSVVSGLLMGRVHDVGVPDQWEGHDK